MTIELHHSKWQDVFDTAGSGFDAMITDPLYDANPKELAPLMLSAHRHDSAVIMFCKPENQFFKPDEYAFWIKTPSTKNYSLHLGRFVEMILIKKGKTFNTLHWSQMTGVYDDRHIYPVMHPWEKPLSLIERLVRIYTKPGDWVFDPFMGSGTVGVACKSLGRHFIGCEIDPAYYDLAQKRIQITQKGVLT